MNRKRVNWVWLLAVMMLLPIMQGCIGMTSVSGGPISGQVLEDSSGKPVVGAIVLGLWQGDAGYGTTVCIHVESAITDAEGRYHIPAWKKSHMYSVSSRRPFYKLTYKAGYQEAQAIGKNAEFESLVLDTNSREQRLQNLLGVSPKCGSGDESEKNQIPLLRAVYEEAQSLAKTKEDKKVLDLLLFDLEIIELGYKAAEKRYVER